ncbi:MAG TPA: hypothetical protein VGX46_13925 [Vicinamibacterales bacterium]|jgi:hypothetical protein|nr:hypothetical protein [Vicinamibacterales bacterium]
MAAALDALHQDACSAARRARSSFGFVPIGVSSHAQCTMAVSGLMWRLVERAGLPMSITRAPNDTRGRRLHLRRDRTQALALLPVVPMTLTSALLMVIVSRCTPAPRPAGVMLARCF